MPRSRARSWTFTRLGGVVLVVLITWPEAGLADNWASFRGGPQLTGVAATALPMRLSLYWTFSAADGIEATAAVVDSTVYAASLSGHLFALDLATGNRRWQYEAEGEIKSSPTVAAGVVYFGDEAGVFHAVDAANGQRRWQMRAGGAISSSAILHGSHLYFGSYDNTLYCLSAVDGSVAWKSATDGYIHATPAIWQSAVVFAGCDGVLRILNAADGSPVRQVGLSDYVGASLAIARGRGYVGTFGNKVLGIDLEAGTILWRFADQERIFPFYASPAVLDTLLIVAGRDKTVRALDTRTGRPKWTFAAGSRLDSSPVISGDRIYFGTDGGELIALALNSGEVVWRFSTGAAVVASPAVAAGKLIIGATDGRLYCFGESAR